MDTFNVSLSGIWMQCHPEPYDGCPCASFPLPVQDEQRLKCYCAGVAPVNYANEARRRLEDIKQMMA